MPKGGVVTQQEIDAAADAEGIDRHLFRGLIKQESAGKVDARSGAGALGPGQLMPATAKGLGVNPNDPIQNLRGSARYLRQQLDRFKGNARLAAAAYNAGPGAVEKYGGVPPFAETQQYVRNVVGNGTMSDDGKAAGARAATPAQQPQPQAQPAAVAVEAPTGLDKLAVLQALKQHDVVGFATGARALKDRELAAQAAQAAQGAQGAAAPQAPAATPTSEPSSSEPSGRGPGKVTITGPSPDRIQPGTLAFGRKISAVLGEPIVGSDGSGHSRLTVNGNVSEHGDGHAVDYPAAGKKLIAMGQAALIAAGMPEAQARKQTGGLFNVVSANGVRHQIIFNTHEGGDHTDHLHASARKVS